MKIYLGNGKPLKKSPVYGTIPELVPLEEDLDIERTISALPRVWDKYLTYWKSVYATPPNNLTRPKVVTPERKEDINPSAMKTHDHEHNKITKNEHANNGTLCLKFCKISTCQPVNACIHYHSYIH